MLSGQFRDKQNVSRLNAEGLIARAIGFRSHIISLRAPEKGLLLRFVDGARARRLESAEEIPQVEYARLYGELRPDIGAAFEPICGGHMIFAGLNSPIGRAVGMGFDGTVKDSDLDRLEEFYRSHNAPAQLDICPLSDPSLLELVKTRGYTVAEFNNVLYRPVEDIEDCTLPPEFEVIAAVPEDALRYSQIVTRSFFPKEDEPADVSVRTDVDVFSLE